MMILTFDQYSNFVFESNSSWTQISSTHLTEGISFIDDKINVDFNSDSDADVVKLDPPKPAVPTRKAEVKVFKGYVMENSPLKKDFAEKVKKWGALEREDLKKLIALTYPKELKEMNVTVLFITGSSDPLSAHIAELIKEMYYPKAKVVDVLKAYYGADVKDVVDWEEYERADPKTKEMIDTYLNKFKYGNNLNQKPRIEFEGYIKKSSGLQSGARRLLNPGHLIDSTIVDTIVDSENYWKEFYLKDKSLDMSIKVKMRPRYLFVDDTIIEGSTLRGIFRLLTAALDSPEVRTKIGQRAVDSILGYCLFGYKQS